MKQYPEERKQLVLNRMMPPENTSVPVLYCETAALVLSTNSGHVPRRLVLPQTFPNEGAKNLCHPVSPHGLM